MNRNPLDILPALVVLLCWILTLSVPRHNAVGHQNKGGITMPIVRSIAGVVLALCAATPALAAKDTVLGRLNLKTGSFTPLQPAQSITTAAKTYTGTIQETLTIQVKSTLPANQTYLCSLSVDVFDPMNESGSLSSSASVSATASAGVLKCTVTIPYSWVLETSSTITATPRWSVYTLQTTEGPSRDISGSFPSFNPETSTATKLTATGEI